MARNPILKMLLITSVALVILASGYYYMNLQNTLPIQKLQDKITNVQSDFNKVHPGWARDQYCTGYGADVSRNNKKICTVLLRNSEIVSYESFTSYLKVLIDDNEFAQVKPVEKITNPHNPSKIIRVSVLSSSISNKISCKFSDADYLSSTEKTGFYLTCSFDANEFIFERRDG